LATDEIERSGTEPSQFWRLHSASLAHRSFLREVFLETRFENVSDLTAAEIVKPAQSRETRRFAVFLMVGLMSG
jgi:hypothetical protein